MKRKEFMEQASKIAGLQYDLWRKFPHYVVTDLTLQTDQHGKESIKYNVHTPELSHNNHSCFEDFIRFMEDVIQNGVIDVRVRILKETLRNATTTKADAIETICETQKELDLLQ